jgi:hypothetical protein
MQQKNEIASSIESLNLNVSNYELLHFLAFFL